MTFWTVWLVGSFAIRTTDLKQNFAQDLGLCFLLLASAGNWAAETAALVWEWWIRLALSKD